MIKTNIYKVYWINDPVKWAIIHSETSFDARKSFRDEYNQRNNSDIPVHECVAVRASF